MLLFLFVLPVPTFPPPPNISKHNEFLYNYKYVLFKLGTWSALKNRTLSPFVVLRKLWRMRTLSVCSELALGGLSTCMRLLLVLEMTSTTVKFSKRKKEIFISFWATHNVIPNSVKPWKYLLKFKMICGPYPLDKLQVPHHMLTDNQAHSSLHLQHSQWRGPQYPKHGGELYSDLHWKCFLFNKLCMFCPCKWLVLQNVSAVKKENVSHISSIIQETRSIPLVLKVFFVCTLHKSVSQFES